MRTRIFLALFVAILMAISVFPRIVRGTMGERMVVDVLDVGQGDAIVVSRGNDRVLIDGGPGNAITKVLPDVLPLFATTFDAVVLSHPHADHIDGLFKVLERYGVGGLFIPDVDGIDGVGRMPEMLELAKKRKVAIHRVARGDEVRIGSLDFFVVAPFRDMEMPGDLNDVSVMMVLRDQDADGDDELLLTGDAGFDGEDMLLREELVKDELRQVELLKVGHHGSATASSEEFLRELSPRFAAISVAKKNRYGHPTKAAVARLKESSAQVVMTKDGGTHTFLFDSGCAHHIGSGGDFSLRMAWHLLLKKPFVSCTIAAN